MAVKNYFTTREASELLGVAVSTIQLWTNNGLLKAWTTGGGHRRITQSSVDEILAQQVATIAGKTSPLSVVIVEDNQQHCRMYKQHILTLYENAVVISSNDGFEGLIKIGSTSPDVIITDLNMPNMNGFQLIRAINNLPELQHCLIIVVTGLTEDEIKAGGGLPKGVSVLLKPVNLLVLEGLLKQITHHKAA